MPAANKPRPVYLNLVRIRLPLPGLVSILHRLSGALLFLFLPLLLGLLQMSLGNPTSFANFAAIVANPLVKLILFGLALAYPQVSYESWQALFANSTFKLLTFLFLVSVFLHAWVGMRDILMDYLKPVAIRLTCEVLVIGALIVYTGWAIQILWGVAK